ncbi:hypothetical protein [Halomonas halocynthiae]|uniref:hypothetical protein n=1 Tax=Halomonas halocynthiae TaxID=176290 RepID=UPI00041A65FB|nr:hypothetical protein [Halomonas halocynthiae]
MLRIGLVLLVVPIIVLMSLYFIELNGVRDCVLNGQGHWDYLNGVCTATPQPNVPFITRKPWLVNGSLLVSVLGLLLCMAGLYVKRR